MSWGMPETAKKLASGWYSELDMTREINADLGRENKKLRERVAELEELTDEKRYIPQEWYQLATAENAKLRKLVTDMCACFRIGAGRDGISEQWCYELFNSYTGKLRELGIEVDE